MSRLRVVLITRRFWPLVGGPETLMANLASMLDGMNCQLTILTGRWDKRWPAQFVHREIPVFRLANPRQRGWGAIRYMRAIQQWIMQHRDQIDLVLVSTLRHDAYAAVKVCGRVGIPVVMRAEYGGGRGDCHWHSSNRHGMRMRAATQAAAAWIVPCDETADELRQAGYAAERIYTIPNGVPILKARTSGRQRQARLALAEAHTILTTPPHEPLVVFAGSFQNEKGLTTLIDAWRDVHQKWTQCKLWLVGDGPCGPALWERVREGGMTSSIVMPGTFDDLTEVLYASDLFVMPSLNRDLSMALLEAMAIGLPVVVSDTASHRHLVSHRRTGLVFAHDDSRQLFAAIAESLEQRDTADTYARCARQSTADHFGIESMARAHADLINRIARC